MEEDVDVNATADVAKEKVAAAKITCQTNNKVPADTTTTIIVILMGLIFLKVIPAVTALHRQKVTVAKQQLKIKW